MKKIREVCLIEDDAIQIFLMKRFLEKTELVENISFYENGKLAFDEMESRFNSIKPFPDVIFLDLNMPIWDGWEFYQAFHKLPASDVVKTYILTSSVSDYDIKKADLLNLKNNYLQKPIDYLKLKSIMEEI